LGSVNALAAGGLTANNGVVDLASYSPTVASLSGSAGVITNNSFEPAILSVNPSVPTATTFSGAFYDGAASVGLTVGGGTLTLLGNNTHSGPTTINGGSLIAGAANSLSPNSFVTVNGGVLDVQAAPQTIGGLSLGSGGVLNLNTSSLLTANALSTLGGTINVFGSTSGTAELISFTGSASGTFTAGTIMPAGYTIGFNSTDTQLDLLKMSTGPATWNVSTSGSWNTGGNWTTNPTVPSGVGVTAVLGSATNLPTTISLDSPQTLGTLTFANSAGYTLAPGTSGNGSLTLDNTGGTNGGQIIVLAGTHSITAPLVISNSAAYVALVNSGSLDISGDIGQTGGSHSLSLSSSDATGVLSLDGTNTFTGGVYVNSGTLVLNGASALLPGSALVIGTTVPASLPSVLSSPVAAPSVNLAPVPEPGTLTLFTVCVVAMGMGLRRRKLAELARRLCRSIV
jgi:autotransporter-associated beta strand protein